MPAPAERAPTDRAAAPASPLRLGWLTDLQEEQVLVYRPDADVDTQKNPDELSGDPVLPGFTLDLGPIWDPDL